MTDVLALDAARTAALVAPVVDRLRMSLMGRAIALGGDAIIAGTGLERTQAEALGLLRNLADRPLPPVGLHAVLAYRPSAEVDAATEALVERGYLVRDGKALRLGDPGHAMLEELHRLSQQAAEELWPEEQVSAVNPLAGRALEAARSDGGPAFAIMAPATPRTGASAAAVLAERLTGLRFHRYDAHVAAWTAAGLTAQQVVGLDGPQREQIEAETNRRAATAYAVLSAEERLALLAGLAALRG